MWWIQTIHRRTMSPITSTASLAHLRARLFFHPAAVPSSSDAAACCRRSCCFTSFSPPRVLERWVESRQRTDYTSGISVAQTTHQPLRGSETKLSTGPPYPRRQRAHADRAALLGALLPTLVYTCVLVTTAVTLSAPAKTRKRRVNFLTRGSNGGELSTGSAGQARCYL